MVEDEEQVLNTNCRMLRRRGYDVRTAQTAAEACHQLEEQLPDLLILAIMLPDGAAAGWWRLFLFIKCRVRYWIQRCVRLLLLGKACME